MIATGLRSLRGVRSGRFVPLPRSLGRSATHPSWRASQCRCSSSSESTAAPKEKPFYITTPIFYVNAAPHIGHLYTMILADVMKRWQQVKGKEAFLSTGTDEHGMKIQQAAYKQEVTPLELCDTNAAKFMALTDEGQISQDAFIRTTQEEHKKAVEQFWTQLKQRLPGSLGLYKDTHAGWYSVDDECFYPEKMVAPFIDPQTGVKVMVCTETNSKVEWIEEETWFFPLTKYKDKLLQFYKDNPGWIQPESKMKEVENWVENNLEDLSVTRPYKRLQWGIRDPDDAKHTIYVWVDALVNYLTVAGYGSEWHPDWNGSEEKMGLWPADVHIVGKDIIRFHAVYWPAMLLGLGLPLPKKILCHNHWKMSNRKMSKSVGNVVNPTFAVQRWGTDGLRYFLMRNGSLHRDSDYSNDSIYATYTKDLQANLGNLYYRIFRPQGRTSWSTREAVDSFARGEFKMNKQLDDPTDPSTHYSALEQCLRSIPPRIELFMDKNEVAAALAHIYSLLSSTNRYVTDTAPWKLTPEIHIAETSIARNWVIFNCAEAVRIASIFLQPIIPSKATRLLDEMKVHPERRTLEWAKYGADTDYGLTREDRVALPKRIHPWEAIFPPVAAAELTDEQLKEEFGGVFANRKIGGHQPTRVAHYIEVQERMGADAVRELAEEQKSK